MTNDRIRESLSAMLDDEATELEVRRLLRDYTEADAEKLARWQLARDLLKGHAVAPVHPDFNSRLNAALAREPAARPGWMNSLSRAAVAASVAVATVVGWQYWNTEPAAAPLTASAETRVPRILGADADLVARGLPGIQASTASLRAEDEQERLEELMVRHGDFAARHSGQGVMASARMVSQDASKEAK